MQVLPLVYILPLYKQTNKQYLLFSITATCLLLVIVIVIVVEIIIIIDVLEQVLIVLLITVPCLRYVCRFLDRVVFSTFLYVKEKK